MRWRDRVKCNRTLWLLLVGIMLAALPNAVAVGPALAPHQSASAGVLNELSDAFARVAEEASHGVVFIRAEKQIAQAMVPLRTPFDMFSDDFLKQFFIPSPRGPYVPNRAPARKRVMFGQGTGFVLSPDGYIVTNHHVVRGADDVRVQLADGREFDAEVAGSDPQTEIAVIKIDAKNLPALLLGNSDDLKVGEWVIAIGNPFGLERTVTAGIVSAKGRGNVGITEYADFIQTDAAINPGNSGGPLLNLRGEVVGVNTAIVSRTGGYMGIGFAIPINMVKFIEKQLREKGSVDRGFLGVVLQDITPDLAEWFQVDKGNGVIITEVKEDSPAQQAGLRRDDIIVECEGQPVKESATFRSRVATTSPGTEVELGILRGGKRITKVVEIGSLETGVNTALLGPSPEARQLGLTVQNLTDDIAERLGYEGESGVVVSQVEPESVAAAAGIKPGTLIKEVNRQRIHNTREFREALARSGCNKPVLLLIAEGEYSRYAVLPLGE